MTTQSSTVLLIDGAHGIYIPRDFADTYGSRFEGVSQYDIDILTTGPLHEHYWETWERVMNDTFMMIDGHKYQLHQSSEGDLWAYCFELMTPDELLNFGFGD